MKYTLALLSLLLLAAQGNAQVHNWVYQTGGPFSEIANDVAVDSQGNVITVGYFQGTVDFDPGPGAVISSSNGQADIFIQKLDSDGNYLWHGTIGNTSWDAARSVDTDDQGNIYVSGVFRNATDFDPGAGVATLPNSSNKEGFILKLNAAGDYQWALDIGATNDDEAWDAIVGEDGSVYTTGWFYGTVDFDNGAGTALLSAASGTGDAYVLKVNSDGLFVWVKKLGGSNWNAGRGLALDGNGNLYTVGTFGSTVDFDPNAGTANLTSNGFTDIFVQKMDTTGVYQWAYAAGSAQDEFAKGVTTDANGNVYVTGQYSLTTDFDAAGTGLNLTSNGSVDIFIEKLDPSGNVVWAQSIGGTSIDDATSIESDHNGNVFVSGLFRDVVDFDGGPGISNMNAGSVEGAGYILKIGEDGSYDWSVSIENTSQTDAVTGIALDQWGYIFGAGNMQQTADFDPSSGTDEITSNGSDDIFVWKIHGCSPSAASTTESICLGETYTVPSGDESYTMAGVYNDTLSSVYGCDSVLTITLEIDSLNYGIDYATGSLYILESTDTGASYQWLSYGDVDCSTGTIIPGETAQSIDLTSMPEGYYGVIVSNGSCSDTTSCQWFGFFGVPDHSSQRLQVFPNPSNGSVYVKLDKPQTGTLLVYSADGRVHRRLSFKDEEALNLELEIPVGVYMLSIQLEDETYKSSRIVITN